MSASTTCTRTTRSRDEPADSSMCCMLDSVMRTCSAIGPRLRSPVCGSTGTMPDKKMYSPTRMPGTCGRFPTREALSKGFLGAIAVRTSPSLIGSGQRGAFDHDLHAVGKARAAHRPCWRRIRKELDIDVIHVRGFQHAVQQHIDLHDLVEGRSCSF